MDRRGIACFDEALADAGIAGNERLRQVLHGYFAWATRTTMSRYHRSADDVPVGLRIPQWSWEPEYRSAPATSPRPDKEARSTRRHTSEKASPSPVGGWNTFQNAARRSGRG